MFFSKLSFLMGLLCTAAVLQGSIDLTGLFVTSKEAKFALTDTESGLSKWISLHQSFEGNEAVEYDAEKEVLVLKKQKTLIRLKLKDSKVREGSFLVTGTITTGIGDVARVTDVTLAFGTEATFPLADDVVLKLTATRRPDGNLDYKTTLEKTLPDGSKQVLSAPSMIGRPYQRVAVEVDQYKFEFQPKSF